MIRVLIVDDEPRVLQMLVDAFEQFEHGHSYTAETARDGAEALTALLDRHFDLVLLDMYMPRLSGLELLQQMRRLGLRIPVLMITGNQSDSVTADALRDGVFAYISKPFDLLYLDHLVALAVATSHSTPASAGSSAGARSPATPVPA